MVRASLKFRATPIRFVEVGSPLLEARASTRPLGDGGFAAAIRACSYGSLRGRWGMSSEGLYEDTAPKTTSPTDHERNLDNAEKIARRCSKPREDTI
jgi:hypothetical protein